MNKVYTKIIINYQPVKYMEQPDYKKITGSGNTDSGINKKSLPNPDILFILTTLMRHKFTREAER